MVNPQHRFCAGLLPIVTIVGLLASCDSPTRPEVTAVRPQIPSVRLSTHADSVAFQAEHGTSSTSGSSTFATTATSIPVSAGDSVVITITSTECSGDPETLDIGGAISGVVASTTCSALVGSVVRLGPASADGTIFFHLTHQVYGTGGPGNVSGTFPNYSVTLDDGYSAIDNNDAVLTVQVIPGACPPTDDPMLNSPEVRRGFADALRNSQPDATPGSGLKREHGGIVWKAPDGHYYTQEVNDPNATECSYNSAVLLPVISAGPPIPGSSAEGKYHTHPSGHLQPTYGCGGGWADRPGDGKQPALADPDATDAGGGSPKDWDNTNDDYPLYAITKTGNIYKLTKQYKNNTSNNPYKYDTKTNRGCPVKQ